MMLEMELGLVELLQLASFMMIVSESVVIAGRDVSHTGSLKRSTASQPPRSEQRMVPRSVPIVVPTDSPHSCKMN